jgi:hypothetical protein
MTLSLGAGLNASVCPVKNIPGRPARIDIYFCKYKWAKVRVDKKNLFD